MATSPYVTFGPQDLSLYNYTRMATQTSTATITTVVKAGPGVLKGITVNTIGGATGTLLVVDGTASASTVVASISGTSAAGTQFVYGAVFGTGISVVAASGSPDVTVIWK